MDESTTPRPARGRRGLGPGLTVFVVVDVLLVLAALVALAAFLSGRDGQGSTTADPSPSVASSAPAPEPSDTTEPEPSEGPEEPGTFASPSGNIACDLSADAATCTIADSTAEPVTVEGCAGPVGQVVTVTAEGASTPCITGAIPGPAAPGTPVLDYGESATVGDFTCLSEETGMTCRHEPSGAGFSLARAGVELF